METTDPRYTRQEALGVVRNQAVAVIGVGGVGSWVALALGLAGVRRLLLFDGDTVDATNLNRLPWGPETIEQCKGAVAAVELQTRAPHTEVSYHGNFDPAYHQTLVKDCAWVVVCTDTLRSRRMVYECLPRGISYIECGAEGHRATVSFSPAAWSTPDEETLGYASVPVFVGPCMLAASIVSYYVLIGQRARGVHAFVASWATGDGPPLGFEGLLLHQTMEDTHGQEE